AAACFLCRAVLALRAFPTRRSSDLVTASYEDASGNAAFTSAGDGGDQVDVTVGSVVLIADSLQLGTAIADVVELTALVRDSNNRSEEHTSELQSREKLVCRLLLEKK